MSSRVGKRRQTRHKALDRMSVRGAAPSIILHPVWQGLELGESGVAAWSGEDSHEGTQMEARAEGADRA